MSALDDATNRAEILLAGGYHPRGRWTLGQVCDHLIRLMSFTQVVSRLPLGDRFIGLAHAAVVRVASKGIRIPTFRRPARRRPMSDADGVRELRRAVERQKRRASPASERMHVWHMEHHLAFLEPAAAASAAPAVVTPAA